MIAVWRRSPRRYRHYDAFRGRIMFPSRTSGARHRIRRPRARRPQPKYLNSPETRLYNKSRNLFAQLLRDEIKKHDVAVLVEGT